MADERDRYPRKTPPAGSPAARALSQGGVVREPIEGETSGVYHDDPLGLIQYRLRRASEQFKDMGGRLEKLEGGHKAISDEVRAVSGKIDGLVTVAAEDKRARADRAQAAQLEREAAEARKEREQERAARERSANRKLIAGIIVPTIAALFTGAAVLISSCRGGPVPVYAPAPASVTTPVERPAP